MGAQATKSNATSAGRHKTNKRLSGGGTWNQEGYRQGGMRGTRSRKVCWNTGKKEHMLGRLTENTWEQGWELGHTLLHQPALKAFNYKTL